MTVAHVTHRLLHVIKQLVGYTLDEVRNSEAVRGLAGYGCLTRVHVVPLLAPRVDTSGIVGGSDGDQASAEAWGDRQHARRH